MPPLPIGENAVTGVNLTLDEVRDIAMRGLTRSGLSEENAIVLADVMTMAEQDGCKTHGLFRMPGYCACVKSGRANGKAAPTLHDRSPGVVQVDARRGFAAAAMVAGRPLLAAKARSQGVAAMPITNAYQSGVLWYDIDALVCEGLVAFAFVNSRSFVAPAGGVNKVYGTNPMAFGWPRPNKAPMIFDQSSSVAARGEIQIRERDGARIPEGWAIDTNGRPTTDPGAALAGAQLPFGGYKGAAIAMMVELLAVGLTGGKFGFESAQDDDSDGGPSEGGELIIAMDPDHFGDSCDGSFNLQHAESLFEKILEEEGTRLPSDRRYTVRNYTRENGVYVPVWLYNEVMRYCTD